MHSSMCFVAQAKLFFISALLLLVDSDEGEEHSSVLALVLLQANGITSA